MVPMSAAVIYARISKDDRGDHLGVDRQEKACRELANRRGLTVLDVLVDNDVSASKGKRRPAFERLVDLLRGREADAVLTYHCDRLYRRGADLERLVTIVESSGAQVHTVAAGDVDLSTASGRMVARMLGAASQHEVERLGERAKMKSDELAAKGRAPGGRSPFGYRWERMADDHRTYVIEQKEAEALRLMARRVLEGASLLSVARELDEAGVTTREGRPWHHSSVRVSLLNPAVAGLRVHRREVAGPGEWEPILDRATWEEVRAVIADPARKRARPSWRYLLTGMVTNPAGTPMAGRPDHGAGGSASRRTYVTSGPAIPGLSIGADDVEAVVIEAALQRLDKAAVPVAGTDAGPGAEVAKLEAELGELATLRGAGTISLAEWMAARQPLQDRLVAARAAAQTTRRPTPATQLLHTPGAARRTWPTLTFAEKRAILQAVVDKVVILPADRGRWTSLDQRIDIVWA